MNHVLSIKLDEVAGAGAATGAKDPPAAAVAASGARRSSSLSDAYSGSESSANIRMPDETQWGMHKM